MCLNYFKLLVALEIFIEFSEKKDFNSIGIKGHIYYLYTLKTKINSNLLQSGY